MKILILFIALIINFCELSASNYDKFIYESNNALVDYFSGKSYDTNIINNKVFIGYNYNSLFKSKLISSTISYPNNFNENYINKISIPINLKINKNLKIKDIIIVYNSYFINNKMTLELKQKAFNIDEGRYLVTTYLVNEKNEIYLSGISSSKRILLNEVRLDSIMQIIKELLIDSRNITNHYNNEQFVKKNHIQNKDFFENFLKKDYSIWKAAAGSEYYMDTKSIEDFFYFNLINESNSQLGFLFHYDRIRNSWYFTKLFCINNIEIIDYLEE